MPRDIPGILLLYNRPFTARAGTVQEHVDAFQAHSGFPVWPVNTELGFPPGLQEFRFRVVVLHYSLFHPAGYSLDAGFLDYLHACRQSYTIAFFQDEYHYCQRRFRFLNDHQVDCVYTLLEPAQFPKVYGRFTNVPSLIYSLPGYVPRELEVRGRGNIKPAAERGIDVGYRGRKLPAYMGRGAQEKYDIAVEFQRRASGTGLRLDIEAEERQRIYGNKWFAFMENCRAVLGVESGVSIFDVEDEVRPHVERLVAENPGISFEELSERLLSPWEERIPYRTISPRHFEAAALRTSQILFEGEYSGLMQPMVHYIPLRKDYANFDDVVSMFNDAAFRQELADNAYRDLIASGSYTYEKFIAGFDQGLREAGFAPAAATLDRRPIDRALRQGNVRRQVRTRLRHARHREFPGRRLLRPLFKPFFTRYDAVRSARTGDGSS